MCDISSLTIHNLTDHRQSSQWETALSPSELRQLQWMHCSLWRNDICGWAPFQLSFPLPHLGHRYLKRTWGSKACPLHVTLLKPLCYGRKWKFSKSISTFWSASDISFISLSYHKRVLTLFHLFFFFRFNSCVWLYSVVYDLSSSIIVTHVYVCIPMNVYMYTQSTKSI